MDPIYPVSEAVGSIAGPHDDRWAHDRRTARKRSLNLPLAQRLERAVPFPLILGYTRPAHRSALILIDDRALRVDRLGRDEQVLPHRTGKQLRGVTDNERLEARVVEHGVPLPAPKRIEVPVAVPDELLHTREEVRIRPPSVEQGNCVPPLERISNLMRSDEARPSENQDSKRPTASIRQTPSSGRSGGKPKPQSR